MVYTISPNKAIGYNPHSPVHTWGGSSLCRKPKQNEKRQIHSLKKLQPHSLNAELPCLQIDSTPKKQVVHQMSRRTKMKIRDKIEIFYASSKDNFSLVTLSFINRVDDKKAISVLNKFLTVLRKRKPNIQYIWVSERQNDNYKYPGNIHFHIVANDCFDIKVYNQLWVSQQFNSGITFENYTKKDIQLFKRLGQVHTILNPFDIKRISCTHGLSAYLTNYVTKNNDLFHCRVWGSSQKISKLYTKQVISSAQFKQLELPFNSRLNKKTGQLYVNKTYVAEHCIINTVINKKYFQKHFMNDLIEINKRILKGEILYSPKMHFDAYDALVENEHLYTEQYRDKQIQKIIHQMKIDNYAN